MQSTMVCPICGAGMNHHADKLVYSPEDESTIGGLVEEMHTCPKCGRTESRPTTISPHSNVLD